MTARAIIDVWDIQSYDAELRGDLDVHADQIRNYMDTSRRLWLEREASDHTRPYPHNPHADEFIWVSDHIGRLMEERTIRAWHYSRMTDAEVDVLRGRGIELSTMDTMLSRLAAQVEAGTFDETVSRRLLAGSPLHADDYGARSNKFWMVSHPHDVEDSGVELLHGHWGGEVVYFWQREPDLQALLQSIGRPRVIEVAVPMASAFSSSFAGSAVVAAYGRSLGCHYDSKAFDLYAEHPLGPEAILAVHSEGDANFDAIGRGYPASFIPDVD